MEIYIDDIYSLHEKLTIDNKDLTCKELKELITKKFGRNTSNCTIYQNKAPLKDNDKISSDSDNFVIVDGDIEKAKMQIDRPNSFYSTSRFQKNQEYKERERFGYGGIAFRVSRSFGFDYNSDDSTDTDEIGDDEENFSLFNQNNSSDANNENTDEPDEIGEFFRPMSDTETDFRNNSSDVDENDSSDVFSINRGNHIVYFFPSDHRLQPFLHRPASQLMFFTPPQSAAAYQVPLQLIVSGNARRPPFLLQQQEQALLEDENNIIIDGNPNENENENDEENENENDDENENNDGIQISLSHEEKEVVNEICREYRDRFDRFTIIQVFEACGRDRETTVQCLSTM